MLLVAFVIICSCLYYIVLLYFVKCAMLFRNILYVWAIQEFYGTKNQWHLRGRGVFILFVVTGSLQWFVTSFITNSERFHSFLVDSARSFQRLRNRSSHPDGIFNDRSRQSITTVLDLSYSQLFTYLSLVLGGLISYDLSPFWDSSLFLLKENGRHFLNNECGFEYYETDG